MTSEGYSTEDILDGEYGKLSPGAPMDGGDIEFDFFNVIFFHLVPRWMGRTLSLTFFNVIFSPCAPMDEGDFEFDFFYLSFFFTW